MKNNFFFTAIIFFQLMGGGHAVHATTICEGIVSTPGSYMGILSKLPEMMAEDFNLISQSASPFNILAHKRKSIELSSARKGLDNLLSQLKDGEWEIIRDLARKQTQILATNTDAVGDASHKTAPVTTGKPIFSFGLGNPGSEFVALDAKDGHTYFAIHDENNRIRVISDTGQKIWESPSTYEILFEDNFNYKHPYLILAEDEHGQKRIEISRVNPLGDKEVLRIDSFKFPSGDALPVQNIPLKDKNRFYIGAHALPNDERYYIFGPSGDSSNILVDQNGQHYKVQDRSEFSGFTKHPDGSTYFISENSTAHLHQLKDGQVHTVWRSEKQDGKAKVFFSRSGRAFVSHASGKYVQEPFSNNSLDHEIFSVKHSNTSFIEAEDGRILLANTGLYLGTKNFMEIYDITGEPKTRHIVQEIPQSSKYGGAFFSSGQGPMYLRLHEDGAHIYSVSKNGATKIGDVKITWGSGLFRFWTAHDKAYVMASSPRSPGNINKVTVYEIFGIP